MARIANFELERQEMYALLAVAVLLFAIYMRLPLPYIDARKLLFLTVILLLAKAFLPPALSGYLLLLLILALIVSALFPFSQLFLLLLLLLLLAGVFGHK